MKKKSSQSRKSKKAKKKYLQDQVWEAKAENQLLVNNQIKLQK